MVPCTSDLIIDLIISKNWRVLNTYIIVSSEMPGNTKGSHVLVVRDPGQNKLKDVSGKMQQQSSNISLWLARDSGGPMWPCIFRADTHQPSWLHMREQQLTIQGFCTFLYSFFKDVIVWDLGLAKKRSSFFVVCKLKEVSQSMVPLVISRRLKQANTVREVFGVDELGEQLN